MKYLIGLKETSEAIKRFALFLTTLATLIIIQSVIYQSLITVAGRLPWIMKSLVSMFVCIQ